MKLFYIENSRDIPEFCYMEKSKDIPEFFHMYKISLAAKHDMLQRGDLWPCVGNAYSRHPG